MTMLLTGVGPPAAGAGGVAPTVVSETVEADGVTLTVVFSVAVDGHETFTLSGTHTIALTYVSGSGTDTLVFTIAETIHAGDGPSGDYNMGVPAVTSHVGGVPMQQRSGITVTNDSEQVLPEVYRFDNSLADAAAGGKDLTSLATAYATGKFGQCYGDPTNILNTTMATRTQDLLAGALDSAAYSVSFWANGGNGGSELVNVQFLNFDTSVVQFEIETSFRTSGGGGQEKAVVRFNNGAAVTGTNAALFVHGTWALICVSVSGGTATLWVNAVQKATLSVPAGLTFDAAGTFVVTSSQDMGIDDLGVKQAALVQADVDALWAGGTGSLYPT